MTNQQNIKPTPIPDSRVFLGRFLRPLRPLQPEAHCLVDEILLVALGRIVTTDGPFWIVSNLLGEYFDMWSDQDPSPKEVS